MNRYTGSADLPSKITRSHPAYLRLVPNSPAAVELAMPPVSGDLVTTT